MAKLATRLLAHKSIILHDLVRLQASLASLACLTLATAAGCQHYTRLGRRAAENYHKRN